MLLAHRIVHNFINDLNGAFKAKAFARAHVESKRYRIKLFLAVYRQVCALRQILANKAIDVFVAAGLPRAMRVAEVDGHAGFLSDFCMPRHLAALAIGHALAYC